MPTMNEEVYQRNLNHLDKLFTKATKSKGTERYETYDTFCTFLMDFQLWKTDAIFRKHLEELLHRYLTEELPREIKKAQEWEYDPELLMAIYNDPALEGTLYGLQHTMTKLQNMMQ
jgi:hypothetical protein